jgi:membrane protease YdiL (CAAX protease family)
MKLFLPFALQIKQLCLRFRKVIRPFLPFAPFIVIHFFIRDILLAVAIALNYRYIGNETLSAIVGIASSTIFTGGVFAWYIKKNGCAEFLLLKNAKIFAACSLLLVFSLLCMDWIIFDGHIANYQLLKLRWLQVDSVGLTVSTGTYIRVGKALDAWGYAPIFESIMILGLLQKPLYQKVSSYKAILIAAAVFALLHWSLEKIPSTFTTGLLYGYLYYKTGKLIYPILCHSLNNLLATFLVYTPGDPDVESAVTLLVVVICFAASLRYVVRYRGKEAAAKPAADVNEKTPEESLCQ